MKPSGKRFSLKTWSLASLTLAGMLALQPAANAGSLPKRSFCVFDPVGANGPLFNLMKSTKPAALDWGVDLQMRAYTDEKIAAEDFKGGQCDSVLLTGTRAREFNKFTGTLEALGAITSNKEERVLMDTLNQPKAAKLLTNGDYEVAGILPAGAVYLFTRNRNIDTVNKLQGKKIATLSYDRASLTMVRHVGASVVGASSASFAGLFNNGSVDLAYAPAVAYTPLELYKGLSHDGGVLQYPLAQMNFQIILHKSRFPKGYANHVREYAREHLNQAFSIINKATDEIKKKYWMYPTDKQTASYDQMLQSVRLSLRDKGVYDAKALKLMKIIRCKVQPSRGECSQNAE